MTVRHLRFFLKRAARDGCWILRQWPSLSDSITKTNGIWGKQTTAICLDSKRSISTRTASHIKNNLENTAFRDQCVNVPVSAHNFDDFQVYFHSLDHRFQYCLAFCEALTRRCYFQKLLPLFRRKTLDARSFQMFFSCGFSVSRRCTAAIVHFPWFDSLFLNGH